MAPLRIEKRVVRPAALSYSAAGLRVDWCNAAAVSKNTCDVVDLVGGQLGVHGLFVPESVRVARLGQPSVVVNVLRAVPHRPTSTQSVLETASTGILPSLSLRPSWLDRPLPRVQYADRAARPGLSRLCEKR